MVSGFKLHQKTGDRGTALDTEKLRGGLHWKVGICIDNTSSYYHPSKLLRAQTHTQCRARAVTLGWRKHAALRDEHASTRTTKRRHAYVANKAGQCAVSHRHRHRHMHSHTRTHAQVHIVELCHAACVIDMQVIHAKHPGRVTNSRRHQIRSCAHSDS